jgi:hypothetical protein
MFFTVATVLLLASAVLSHGIITVPPSRGIGPAISTACGQAITSAIKSDNTSYVEQLTKLASSDSKFDAAACDLYLCKGLQFSDNSANVQTWKASDVVPIKIWLRIPHEGIANVSIVSTKQNKQVGDFLKIWSSGYAPGKSENDVPFEQREFSVTIPSGLESTCANAGDCVSQYSICRGACLAETQYRCFSGGGWALLQSRRTSLVLTSRSRRLASPRGLNSSLRTLVVRYSTRTRSYKWLPWRLSSPWPAYSGGNSLYSEC